MSTDSRVEVEKMLTLLRRAYAGPSWHGPSVKEALAGITWEQAERRRENIHSILELVIHIAAWKHIVRQRLLGAPVQEITPEMDWPAPQGTGQVAWDAALARLEQSQKDLLETLAGLSDEHLKETLKKVPLTIQDLLHGLAQHDLYHTGQIALLKKLQS